MATKFGKIQIKITAIVVILCFVAFVLSTSPSLVSKAENDPIIDELTHYKTWTRINRTAITVKAPLADQTQSDKTIFIVDGQEVTNFRSGDLGG
jgi:hypothetical protein